MANYKCFSGESLYLLHNFWNRFFQKTKSLEIFFCGDSTEMLPQIYKLKIKTTVIRKDKNVHLPLASYSVGSVKAKCSLRQMFIYSFLRIPIVYAAHATFNNSKNLCYLIKAHNYFFSFFTSSLSEVSLQNKWVFLANFHVQCLISHDGLSKFFGRK